MKRFNLLGLFLVGLLILVTTATVKAQDAMPPDVQNQDFDKPNRPNLLEELGLTLQQRQQIRQLNAESKPQMREAQERLREANRNLDQAIYADIVNESDVQARLREVQLAQAEVFKIRALTELAVRQILTPEQLQKFRQLRQQFMERMKDRKSRPRGNPMNITPPENKSRPRQMRPQT